MSDNPARDALMRNYLRTENLRAMSPNDPISPVSVLPLAEDNDRLRALIKSIEWHGCVGRDSDRACPFCNREPRDPLDHGDGEHAPDCAAFTSTGEVK